MLNLAFAIGIAPFILAAGDAIALARAPHRYGKQLE